MAANSPAGVIEANMEKTPMKPVAETPKSILARSQAREGFTRTLIGGGILCLLVIAYIVALFLKVEGASSILVVIAAGVGCLLSKGRASGRED